MYVFLPTVRKKHEIVTSKNLFFWQNLHDLPDFILFLSCKFCKSCQIGLRIDLCNYCLTFAFLWKNLCESFKSVLSVCWKLGLRKTIRADFLIVYFFLPMFRCAIVAVVW
jgi:hypothetical protein